MGASRTPFSTQDPCSITKGWLSHQILTLSQLPLDSASDRQLTTYQRTLLTPEYL